MQELEKLYPNPPIPLHHQDAFTLLIAVLLSAQTTDKKVNEVTPALFARANNAKEMMQLMSNVEEEDEESGNSLPESESVISTEEMTEVSTETEVTE